MSAQPNLPHERIRLVLAGASHLLLDMEKSFFPESEFDVMLAHNGCEAYNLVKTFEPAVIFLDLFMPLLNGEECCRLIKSDPRLCNTRVVLVAADDERHLRRCRDAQSDLVVTKPVRRRNFLGAVETLAGRLCRVPARWPVRLAARLYEDDRCCLTTWTVNLCDRGAYLESADMLPMGKRYMLRLHVSENETLLIAARIAWHNSSEAPRDRGLPSGFGLQFLELRNETRLRLRQLLGEPTDAGALSTNDRSAPARMFIELPMLTGKNL